MKVTHLTDAEFGSIVTEIELENLSSEEAGHIVSLWN